jgi:THO complex subunit 4
LQSQPKNAAKAMPKAATAGKKTDNAAAGKTAGRRGRNAGRPKRKTAEELDQDMADYFVAGTSNTDTAMTGGAVQAPAEAPVADEIMVRMVDGFESTHTNKSQ